MYFLIGNIVSDTYLYCEQKYFCYLCIYNDNNYKAIINLTHYLIIFFEQ